MNLATVCRLLALLCFLTATVIGFVEAFASNPLLDYPWGLAVVTALIAAGLGLVSLTVFVKTPTS